MGRHIRTAAALVVVAATAFAACTSPSAPERPTATTVVAPTWSDVRMTNLQLHGIVPEGATVELADDEGWVYDTDLRILRYAPSSPAAPGDVVTVDLTVTTADGTSHTVPVRVPVYDRTARSDNLLYVRTQWRICAGPDSTPDLDCRARGHALPGGTPLDAGVAVLVPVVLITDRVPELVDG